MTILSKLWDYFYSWILITILWCTAQTLNRLQVGHSFMPKPTKRVITCQASDYYAKQSNGLHQLWPLPGCHITHSIMYLFKSCCFKWLHTSLNGPRGLYISYDSKLMILNIINEATARFTWASVLKKTIHTKGPTFLASWFFVNW